MNSKRKRATLAPTEEEAEPELNPTTKEALRKLVKQIDSNAILDPDVEDLLLQFTREAAHNITSLASLFAQHRESNTLQVEDVALAVDKELKLNIPGFLDFKTSTKKTVNKLAGARVSAVQIEKKKKKKK